ncbi:hypothetical protein [Rhodopirellula sallentina]|uniref:Uncharacterized protein n=1 Tax=Rhodopirellula sallentina SM41 TaxID=1263870 RepID=M5TX09_9BACT|nr:hypothetical protein [Rhodopirellula sallentina]EMI53584.1 hypothetical protein RSSM_04924 [Rhodopirellula sallentina SM41]
MPRPPIPAAASLPDAGPLYATGPLYAAGPLPRQRIRGISRG